MTKAVARDRTATADTPALKLTGITKSFGPVTAVDNISLAIPRNQVIGLIDENGAGKSTTEFALWRLGLSGSPVDVPATDAGRTLVVVDGSATLTSDGSEIHLERGRPAFLEAGTLTKR